MTNKQEIAIADFEDSSDNVWSVAVTAEEIRDWVDMDEYGIWKPELLTVLDEVQGSVFNQPGKVSYLIIKVTP